MYSTCLFCHEHLGYNEQVSWLPVGRRIAFDPTRGRLWVVCTECGRWNLTPFEERWEGIEECERIFRNTRLRVATDNIGLAQPHWGFELVRIGAALRPEIAAWRYGTKLLSRHTTIAGYAKNLGVNQRTVMKLRMAPRRFDVLARVPLGDSRASVRYSHLPDAEILRPDADQVWRLRVRHDQGLSTLHGQDAIKAARVLLTALNDGSAPESMVRSACIRLDEAGHSDNYFARVGAAERLIVRLTTRSFWSRGGTGSEERSLLYRLPDIDRLALEMAANEDAERRALQGELRALREAWQEAEEVAAIADHLLDDVS